MNLLGFIASLVSLVAFANAAAATFVVDRAADDTAPGSLRHAITAANTNPGPDRVTFATGMKIAVASELPAINDTVHLLGPPEAPTAVDIVGSSAFNGLTLENHDDSVVQNVVVRFFAKGVQLVGGSGHRLAAITALQNVDGVYVAGSTNVTIVGSVVAGNSNAGINLRLARDTVVRDCFVGCNAAGTARHPVGGNVFGIYAFGEMTKPAGNFIGPNNVIGGNRVGIVNDDPAYTTIVGNHVGVDLAGGAAIPNDNEGISCLSRGANAIIGGFSSEERNVVSGNLFTGILIKAGGVVVRGNYVGIDASGQYAVPNGASGIETGRGSFGAIIDSNVASGNGEHGVSFYSHGNLVKNCLIGVNAVGAAAIGNNFDGVFIDSSAIGCIVSHSIISGNNLLGISVKGPGSIIDSCFIGTDKLGLRAIPNIYLGVGLSVNPGDNVVVRDCVLSGNNNAGIGIDQVTRFATISGNLIGLDATGRNRLPNVGGAGVLIQKGADYIQFVNNTVSGNEGQGLAMESKYCFLSNNKFGTDNSGMIAVPNTLNGIVVNGVGTILTGNIISGNILNGLYFTSNSQGATLTSNIIGLNVMGASLGNGGDGLNVNGPSNKFKSNVISSNTGFGAYINGPFNSLENCTIGLDKSGTLPRGNGAGGVFATSQAVYAYIGPACLISANIGPGLVLNHAWFGFVVNNSIGLTVDDLPAGNSGNGVEFSGRLAQLQFNKIAYSGGVGALVNESADEQANIEDNLFFNNALEPLLVLNQSLPTPVITMAQPTLVIGTFQIPVDQRMATVTLFGSPAEPVYGRDDGRYVLMKKVFDTDQLLSMSDGRMEFAFYQADNWAPPSVQYVTVIVSFGFFGTTMFSNFKKISTDDSSCLLCLCDSQIVDCRNQILAKLPVFPSNLSATHVDLSGNLLGVSTTLQDWQLFSRAAGPVVQILNLSNSGVLFDDWVPSANFSFPALKKLYLRRNGLQVLPHFSRIFPNLTLLDLSDNYLTSAMGARSASLILREDTFQGMEKLTELFLSDCLLSFLPAGVFNDLTELLALYLANNRLTSLSGLVLSRSLNKLGFLSLKGQFISPARDDVNSTGFDVSALAKLQGYFSANPYNCSPGFYSVFDQTCFRCEPGTFKFGDSPQTLSDCQFCPGGTVDDDNHAQSACTPCPPGSYSPAGASGSCQFCEAGTTDDDHDPSTVCSLCPAGTFAPANGSGPCRSCPAGSTDGDADSKTPCDLCPGSGFFAPRATIGACPFCVAGTLDSDGNSSTPCEICQVHGSFIPSGASKRSCLDAQFYCENGYSDTDYSCGTPCQFCGPGTYVAKNSSGPCSLFSCPVNFTDDDFNPTTPCVPCGAETFTRGTGNVGPVCTNGGVVVGTSDGSVVLPASIGGTLGAVSLCCALLLAVILRRRYRTQQATKRPFSFEEQFALLKTHGLISDLGPARPRELHRKYVKVLEKIGDGQYGFVSKGLLNDVASRGVPEYAVAIKVMKASSSADEVDDFMREAAIMAQFNHRNVVSLVGVVTVGEPKLLLLQLCENGSLLSFLKSRTGFNTLLLEHRVAILGDVAEGMKYLASLSVVHRDLAARNVLVSADFVCKVSDFGLSREILEGSTEYYSTKRGLLPLRWTSPECLGTRRFTTASDVWAFGILCGEVFDNGQRPFANLSDQEVWIHLQEGKSIQRPPLCPANIFLELIQPCFAVNPAARPTFPALAGLLRWLGSTVVSPTHDSTSHDVNLRLGPRFSDLTNLSIRRSTTELSVSEGSSRGSPGAVSRFLMMQPPVKGPVASYVYAPAPAARPFDTAGYLASADIAKEGDDEESDVESQYVSMSTATQAPQSARSQIEFERFVSRESAAHPFGPGDERHSDTPCLAEQTRDMPTTPATLTVNSHTGMSSAIKDLDGDVNETSFI